MNPNMLIADDEHLSYPRICAHRGLSAMAPENSLPAYGAAVALGADEIELDIWPTKDGELVSIHDRKLDRISNGNGDICEHTLEELMKLDFGIKFSESFSGLKVLLFEDVLKKFGHAVIMNVHMKMWDLGIDEPYYEKIAELIRKYDCQKYVYMMSVNEEHLTRFHEVAPEISRCIAFNCKKSDPFAYIYRASEMGLQKIQISSPTAEVIEYAHRKGLICNIYYADTLEKASQLLEMGADTILSNNILRIAPAFNACKRDIV